jgi:hypothetical protein
MKLRLLVTVVMSLLIVLELNAQSEQKTLSPSDTAIQATSEDKDSCNDEAKECGPPTCYLGESDGCSCYVCNFGDKSKQRRVCTKNMKDRELLQEYANKTARVECESTQHRPAIPE